MITFAAILVSLLAIFYLASTDPKRRRAFQLPAIDRPAWSGFVWIIVFLPGFGLLALYDWAGFTIWAGAITSLGWMMVALSPVRYARIKSRLFGHPTVQD